MARKKKLKEKRKQRRNKNKKDNSCIFRSGLEDRVIGELEERGISYDYEFKKIRWTEPSKTRIYTPDIFLWKKEEFREDDDEDNLYNYMIIEVKGNFDEEARYKHNKLWEQYPDLDLRFVFGNSRNKYGRINKAGEKMDYQKWCNTRSIKFSEKSIPVEWLQEVEDSSDSFEDNLKSRIEKTTKEKVTLGENLI